MKKWLMVAMLGCLAGMAQAQVTVSNVRAEQRVGTDLVDILYDIAFQGDSVTVSLEIKDNGVPVNAASATGHIGSGFTAKGSNRKITWNAAADWGDWKGSTNMSFKVTAVAAEMPTGGDVTAVEWANINSRWVKNIYANGQITMSDRSTGLMWLFGASYCGVANWNNAFVVCNNLTYAGKSDWFLPSKDQLFAMCSQKSLFVGVQENWYWSSTIYYAGDGTTGAWRVDMTGGGGTHGSNNIMGLSCWVWPCRSGQ